MLQYVVDTGPTSREAIRWLIQTFERANSEKVARGYWQVLRSIGLTESDGEQLVATAAGAEYLASKHPGELLRMLAANVIGIDHMIESLREPVPRWNCSRV